MSTSLNNSKSNLTFFGVGCWNRGCIREQQEVFREIIEQQDEMESLLILGDNVYSNKDIYTEEEIEKLGLHKKSHSYDTYIKGLKCLVGDDNLRQLDKSVFFVLGNHDISINKNEPRGECFLYNTQKNATSFNPNFKTQYPFNSIDINKNGIKIKLIFIDSNFADLGVSYMNNNSCIQINSENLSKLQNQLTWLEGELENSEADHNLIIAHHPLLSNKMGTKGPKNSYIKELIVLFDNYLHKNITYLCADTHMYQHWRMTNKQGLSLTQIVCGTGGALLNTKNSLTREMPIDIGSNRYLFTKLEEIDKTYGFCKLHFNKRNVRVEFVPI